MKKLGLLALLLNASAALSAQQFEGGFVAGIAGSQVAGDTYSGYRKAGVYAGFWVNYPLSPQIGLQTELVYFQKGSRHNPDEKRSDFTFYIMRLGYIEMPLLLQYRFSPSLAAELGLSAGILLHSSEQLDYSDVSYGRFALINPSVNAGLVFSSGTRWKLHLRTANSLLSIRTEPVNGARRRIFDLGQYSDAVTVLLSYTL